MSAQTSTAADNSESSSTESESDQTLERHQKLGEYVVRINELHDAEDFENEVNLLGEAGAACVDLRADQDFRQFFAQRTVELLIAWGRLDLAEQLLLSELHKCETTHYPRGLAASEAALGRVLYERGRPLEAEPLLRDALEYVRNYGKDSEIAVTSLHTAQVLVALGHLDEAEDLLQTSQSMMQDLDYQIGYTLTISVMGQLLAKRGKHNEAIRSMYDAAAQFEEFKQWHMLARNLVALGDILVIAKKYPDAVSSYNDAQDYYLRGDDHLGRAVSHLKSGEVLLKINADLGLAENQFTWARDILVDLEMPEEVVKAEAGLDEVIKRRAAKA